MYPKNANRHVVQYGKRVVYFRSLAAYDRFLDMLELWRIPYNAKTYVAG